MNSIKEVWLNVKSRVNTITVGYDYETGYDDTYGVELSDVMDDEEIKLIDSVIDEVERLRLENAQLRGEVLTKEKEEAVSKGRFVSEAKYSITGRGNVYVLDMTDYLGAEIKLGDVITIDKTIGIVRGIEGTRNLFGEIGPKIGILFREVQTI